MSDLGRLFRLSTAGPKLLENFTTTALAIAIRHDDRPMKHALATIDWACQPSKRHPAPPVSTFKADDIYAIAAETQVPLRAAGDADPGYLDVVLQVDDVRSRRWTMWIEARVDAWESGDQLENYMRHAERHTPKPVIVTLARVRVAEDCPSLTWADIVEAIDTVPDAHYMWVSLRDFLLDEKILDDYLAGAHAKGRPSTPPGLPTFAPVQRTGPQSTRATILLGAAAFAALRHGGQRRKGSDESPYINHPIAVAHLLAGVGGIDDVDTLLAAVLHDTIEDTETTAEELETQFGPNVSKIVQELTDDKTLPKVERKQRQIEHAPHMSRAAKAIKIADKISNVRDVTWRPAVDWNDTRRLEYLAWAQRVVAGCAGTNEALERLFDQVVAEGREAILRASASFQPRDLPSFEPGAGGDREGA